MPAKPAAKAAAQSYKGEGEEEMVQVGSWYLLSGTFTVHASHPLKFTTGFHQVSYPAHAHEVPTRFQDAVGLERLGDSIHKLTFVADGVEHPVGY